MRWVQYEILLYLLPRLKSIAWLLPHMILHALVDAPLPSICFSNRKALTFA